jgi:hypothetical protein
MSRRNTLVFMAVLIIFTPAALVVLPVEEGSAAGLRFAGCH